MATTYRQQFLALMRDNEQAMTDLFRTLHARLMALVYRTATGTGQTIPPQFGDKLRLATSHTVVEFFLGNQLEPFTVQQTRLIPQSDYMRVLHDMVTRATRLGVEEQAAIMRRKLANAPDVVQAFERARINPFTAARRVQEQELRPRPFLEYDPYHRFADQRGYTLSQRIWDTSTATRRKIDLYLQDAIIQGKSAVEISRELEQFLLPGRKLVTTTKPYPAPYGTTASFDAMRLARTEIAAAQTRSGWMAAQMNPFVAGYEVVVSGSHVEVDICDEEAAGGPYDITDPSHLPPLHPQCLCRTRWTFLQETAEVISDLRAQVIEPMWDSLIAMVGPLLVDQFAEYLLSEYREMFSL